MNEVSDKYGEWEQKMLTYLLRKIKTFVLNNREERFISNNAFFKRVV